MSISNSLYCISDVNVKGFKIGVLGNPTLGNLKGYYPHYSNMDAYFLTPDSEDGT